LRFGANTFGWVLRRNLRRLCSRVFRVSRLQNPTSALAGRSSARAHARVHTRPPNAPILVEALANTLGGAKMGVAEAADTVLLDG